MEVRGHHQVTSSVFLHLIGGGEVSLSLELTDLARPHTREPQGPSCLYSVPSVYKGARV